MFLLSASLQSSYLRPVRVESSLICSDVATPDTTPARTGMVGLAATVVPDTTPARTGMVGLAAAAVPDTTLTRTGMVGLAATAVNPITSRSPASRILTLRLRRARSSSRQSIAIERPRRERSSSAPLGCGRSERSR